ncbi:kelch repeat-containing protein [Strigomonas culicis]|nr:kelch repeat-containing protein [Strigomonas culicis]|eukprot:EPY18729.1 kelch repeat-containing protein [Strigomonas culicis]
MWNGEITEAYNDTYFYNTKKNAWSKLSTPVNPLPRSSCQGITFRHYLILFGGEFVSQSQSQYHHFKDVWRFDSRTSEWEELKALKGGPCSRSGHRMVAWKKKAVVFGGFYDNAQECRYFDDLWILSDLEGAGLWTPVNVSQHSVVPHARSGHSMAVHDNTVFVYGGYSTEKFNRFKKSEATVHHDLWLIDLSEYATSGSKDVSPLQWRKVKLGGVPPPIRSGVGSVFKDKKMYLFGGVVDIESPGGKLVSTFSNDLFVFHMDTQRFFPVVLRSKKTDAKATGVRTALRKKQNIDDLQEQLEALQLVSKNAVDEDDEEDDSSSTSSDELSQTEESKVENLKKSYEVLKNGQCYPHRRMDAALTILGTQLFIYGGQFESGSKEVTMADLFVLNLNHLETYDVLLSQDLSAAVWLGKESDSDAGSWESGSTVVSAAFDIDYDEDEEDEEDHDEKDEVDFSQMPRQVLLDEDDDGEEAPEAIPAELDTEMTPNAGDIADALTKRKGKKGLQVHKEQLLAQLSDSAVVPTPQREEVFDAFWSRSSAFWLEMAKESLEGNASPKQLNKDATSFAKRRFHEAKELLKQLRLVEEREEEEARFFRERRRQKEKEWEEYEAQLQRDQALEEEPQQAEAE